MKKELPDVVAKCQKLPDKLGMDADKIINMKMTQNEANHPAEKAKGKTKSTLHHRTSGTIRARRKKNGLIMEI